MLVKLEDSPFCYLLFRDHQLQFCVLFANEDMCNDKNLVSVDVLIEGIKIPISSSWTKDETWWCSDLFIAPKKHESAFLVLDVINKLVFCRLLINFFSI